MVEYGQELLYSRKVVVFEKNGCIRAKWLYSGKSRCIRAKELVFGQSSCSPAKMVLFGQKSLYSGQVFV